MAYEQMGGIWGSIKSAAKALRFRRHKKKSFSGRVKGLVKKPVRGGGVTYGVRSAFPSSGGGLSSTYGSALMTNISSPFANTGGTPIIPCPGGLCNPLPTMGLGFLDEEKDVLFRWALIGGAAYAFLKFTQPGRDLAKRFGLGATTP